MTHDKQIPPSIKEAALTWLNEVSDSNTTEIDVFTSGALHPETEKYYREMFEKDLQGMLDYINENGTLTLDIAKGTELHSNIKNISINRSVNLLDVFNLYKQSLTKNKEDGKSK